MWRVGVIFDSWVCWRAQKVHDLQSLKMIFFKNLLGLEAKPDLDKAHVLNQKRQSLHDRISWVWHHFKAELTLCIRLERHPSTTQREKGAQVPDGRRAVFILVKKKLHDCCDDKFGLQYQDVLHTMSRGQTHKSEDPNLALELVNKRLGKNSA